MNAPSAYAMEAAMSALMSARARLLNDDPELAEDEAALDALLDLLSGDAARDATGVADFDRHAAVDTLLPLVRQGRPADREQLVAD